MTRGPGFSGLITMPDARPREPAPPVRRTGRRRTPGRAGGGTRATPPRRRSSSARSPVRSTRSASSQRVPSNDADSTVYASPMNARRTTATIAQLVRARARRSTAGRVRAYCRSEDRGDRDERERVPVVHRQADEHGEGVDRAEPGDREAQQRGERVPHLEQLAALPAAGERRRGTARSPARGRCPRVEPTTTSRSYIQLGITSGRLPPDDEQRQDTVAGEVRPDERASSGRAGRSRRARSPSRSRSRR